MPGIHEQVTLTFKGQITLPKAIRQTLGVTTGGKVFFELRGDDVIVTHAQAEHEDPAIGAFLGLLEQDIRQGNTLGPAHRHWCRARIGRCFRLFFRYHSRSKTIVFAWVNDEQTLRSAGSKSDPYAVFEKMLQRGNGHKTEGVRVEISPGRSTMTRIAR